MKFTADFETTTDPNDCRVWATGICTIDEKLQFFYGNDIDYFFKFAKKYPNSSFYFHNLKFDGEFIFVWLFEHGFKHVEDRKLLDEKTFTTVIADTGQFYSIQICWGYYKGKRECTMIYDSLKILPFKVEEVAEGFGLEISKLEIDYDEYRPPGHELTQDEIDYLRNDVQIMSEALQVLFAQNLTKMTQAGNALFDYKQIVGKKRFDASFPPPEYDSFIRKSYKGGWTYVNPKFQNQILGEGIVLDVNSLYPYVMYEKELPIGEGIYFTGRYTDDPLYPLYVQHFSCMFELKEGYLPTLQLKNNLRFVPNEYLSSSDGEIVELWLTSVDMEIFFEHYNPYFITFHDGYMFRSTHDAFKPYIDKWMEVKIESTKNDNKAMRTLAKLMLNALYGKFGTSPILCSKWPYYKEGQIKYKNSPLSSRTPLYIPMASFITAWARHVTITAAQSVYERFVYADTDSLHLIGTEIPKGLRIDGTALGAWKHESTFTKAKFVRQKCYLEEIKGKTAITCAGMPTSCYPYVTWDNFKVGTSYGGKLVPKHVKGGIILNETEFTIRG